MANLSSGPGPEELALAAKMQAAKLGFAACGITGVEPCAGYDQYLHWLHNGYHAGMEWMNRPDARQRRRSPRDWWPEARSVICVALLYRTEVPWDEAACGKVARYARGRDYHRVLKKKLRRLLEHLQGLTPCEGRIAVDTSAVLERDLAVRAGLGWIGKNSMLISRDLGSWFLLGELMVDLPLQEDAPLAANYCGTCSRCLDACPTTAFVAPGVLDASRCISYHTIENGGAAPRDMREGFGEWLFGCDVCQEVCPWNGHSTARSPEPDLWSNRHPITLHELVTGTPLEVEPKLVGSPLRRPRRGGLRRSARRIMHWRRHHRF